MFSVSRSTPKTSTRCYMTPLEYALMCGLTEHSIRSRMKGDLKEFVGVEDGKHVIYTTVFTKYPPSDDGKTFHRNKRMTKAEVASIISWAKEHKATPVQISEHFSMNYRNAVALIRRHQRELVTSRAVAPFAAAEGRPTINISRAALERLLGCSVNITED